MLRIVGIRRRADAKRAEGRIFADAIVSVQQDRERVAHALPDGPRHDAAHAANHSPRQPVAWYSWNTMSELTSPSRESGGGSVSRIVALTPCDSRDFNVVPVVWPTKTAGIRHVAVAADGDQPIALIVGNDHRSGACALCVDDLVDERGRCRDR